MNLSQNLTFKSVEQSSSSTYDDNKDIIWPTVVGIFVALALGWMICRYKCSSKERSPHIVRCCPKSLCKNLRRCCTFFCRFSSDERQDTISEQRTSMTKPRSSNPSVHEVPFLTSANRSSLAHVSQQWPPAFLLDQSPSFPLSIAIQTTSVVPPCQSQSQFQQQQQPKRHPLRRDSNLPGFNSERRESSLWPFRTINAVFHKQTSEIKENDLFLSS